jgi:carbon monoxide dehydrogenase subunit G
MKPIHWWGSWLIRAPREQVFAMMTDFDNWPRMMPRVVKSARIIERDENTVVLSGSFSILGQRGDAVMNIRLDPPGEWVAQNHSGQLGRETEIIRFEAVDLGTRLTWEVDVEPKKRVVRLVAPLLTFPIRWFYQRAIVQPLRNSLEMRQSSRPTTG